MLRQLVDWLRQQARRLARALHAAWGYTVPVAQAVWGVVRAPLMAALNVLAALVLLFEEWGWRPLSNLLAHLARFRIWALGELWIAGLPPYGALLALAVPSAILIPAKLIGVYLLAIGQVATAIVILVCAKLASTALIARIFILTKPSLMRIGWFARSYDAFVPWQEALFEWIRGSWIWRYGRIVNWRVKNFARRAWARMRPRVLAAWTVLRPKAVALGRGLQRVARDAGKRSAAAAKRLFQRLRSPKA